MRIHKVVLELSQPEKNLLKRQPEMNDEEWENHRGRFEDEVVVPIIDKLIYKPVPWGYTDIQYPDDNYIEVEFDENPSRG